MIFFVVMPIMVGCFGNFLIPLMIGARDMAFPEAEHALVLDGRRLGRHHAGRLLRARRPRRGRVDGLRTALGRARSTPASNWGQNLWLISLFVLGVSSMMGSINYITTVVNMRAPGMTLFRLPLVIWSLFITAILLLLALPVLTSAAAMLLFDRTIGTHWFDPSGGGEPLLWQHLFWFFGHPEVYILVLPAMGVTSDVLSTFARKPIFGYRAMAYSMISIAFLSWIVYGHHMFISGMSPALGTSFMLTTMVIAVPSAIKSFNWLGTLWGGSIRFTTPMIHAISFLSTFTIGGLSGIFMANTPVDIFIHDTYFIVAHFHYVVAGIIFAMFAAITYWYPKLFGRQMNETVGRIHAVLTFVFFNLRVLPDALPRRGRDDAADLQPDAVRVPAARCSRMAVFMSGSAFILGAVQILFIWNFVASLFKGRKADRNPWHSNTLEWTAESPPPHGNWGPTIPTVYRGPYEYSVPGMTEDYLPQTQAGPAPAPGPGGHGH